MQTNMSDKVNSKSIPSVPMSSREENGGCEGLGKFSVIRWGRIALDPRLSLTTEKSCLLAPAWATCQKTKSRYSAIMKALQLLVCRQNTFGNMGLLICKSFKLIVLIKEKQTTLFFSRTRGNDLSAFTYQIGCVGKDYIYDYDFLNKKFLSEDPNIFVNLIPVLMWAK